MTAEPARAADVDSPPPPVVYLHVGAPKTGTTQLQDVLFGNRDALRDHGVLVPGRQRQSHFHATIDLLDMPWGGLLDGARGCWDELVAEIDAWPGVVVVSNENLSLADDADVARVRAALPDRELRVVYSARDLARQIPAAWQEQVKHFHTRDYATFIRHLREDVADEDTRRFWQRQTWPDVLDRWTRELGGVAATLVTVPLPGQDPGLLLARFLEAFGLEEGWVRDRSARSNPGLGSAETTLLRLIQVELADRDVKSVVRHTAVRGVMLGRWWASRPAGGRIALPAAAHAWALDLSAEWVERVKATDVRVVGDLADLVPAPATMASAVDPDEVPAHDLLDVAVRTVADALEEVSDLLAQRRMLTEERDRLRAGSDESHAEVDRLRSRVHHFERGWWQATKEWLVAGARSNRLLGLAHTAYRRTRRR